MGRTLDSQKEYMQIPIKASQASFSVAVPWHPGYRAPKYYGHRALSKRGMPCSSSGAWLRRWG